MSLSNLYFRGCFEQPSEDQINAVANIPGGDVDGVSIDEEGNYKLNIVDKSCTREDLNTCGISIQDLLFDREEQFVIDPRLSPRGDIDIVNDQIFIKDHGLLNGEIAYYSHEGPSLGGLNSSGRYFVKPISKDIIELYSSRNLLESDKINITSQAVETEIITFINIENDTLYLEDTSIFTSGDIVYYHCDDIKTFNILSIDSSRNTLEVSNYSVLNDKDLVYFKFEKLQESDSPLDRLVDGGRFFVKKIGQNEISLYYYDDLADLSIVNISGTLSGNSYFERIDNIEGLIDNGSYYIKIVDDNFVSLHTSRTLSNSSKININGIFNGNHSLNKIYKNFLIVPPIGIYSTQKGLYKTWGEIEFPWEISALTPDLFFELTDDKWSVGTYRRITAYPEGVRVLLIEDDGYEVGLYEANQDIVSISGPFDYLKWDKVCGVKTTIQVGLPTIEELRERYAPYSLKYFYDQWDEVESTWSEGTYELALQACQAQGGSLADFEKCMRDSSSDVWKDTRVRREFFYQRGDIVLIDGECGDVVCVWIAIQDMPATEEVYNQYVKFAPGAYWQKIYCVGTDRNKCLEYERKKEPALGYDVVQIGSLGHYVEVPVPYRLKPTTPDLNDRAQPLSAPTVLTQEQIDALTQPTEE